ncbi:MAG: SDR family oxidoreductase [Pirellulales bacterium]
MPRERNRTILITGVSRGLGRAMVAQFVERGCTVVGCARRCESVDELKSEYCAPHRFHCVDVADDAQVAAWAQEMLAAVGPPDLLLNNAAVINANAPLWEVPLDDFARCLDINVKGTFHVLRHFLPAMVKRRQGVIVNFSSGWGRATSPEVAPYCATKWAIEGLTQALAEELPSGMAAVPLNPGIIDTDMLRSCFQESASAYPAPEQWAARAVPFLLELNSRHNGQPLTVPG